MTAMPAMFDDPDAALMLRVRRDEADAFAELVARYGGKIFARIYRCLPDRQEAEDLTQDTFLRVYRSRKKYRPHAKFATWIYFIAQNVVRNALRSKKRRSCLRFGAFQAGEDPGKDDFQEPRIVDNPARPLELQELARTVRAAVDTLADRQRQAIEMQHFQNRSYTDIARRLDLTLKATKSLLYRARVQLRDSLSSPEEIC